MSGTNQTDAIEYIRPGGWSASVGLVGIDELHTFASDPRQLTEPPPPVKPGVFPLPGPSAQTKAPAQNSRRWWRKRSQSTNELDALGNDGQWLATTEEPQGSKTKPRDPRTQPIPSPRWTGTMGPVLVGYMHRTTEGTMYGARRFVDHAGSSFAYAPSTRQSPMALGDGRGTKRFRPTQRNRPETLDQQTVSIDEQTYKGGSVLMSGPGIQSYW